MNKRLLRQSEAPDYLSMSAPMFNQLVRPYVTEINYGRMVMYDVLDLDAWVVQFKAANGKPATEKPQWQNVPLDLEKKAKSGTSKKLSAASSFEEALAKRSLKKQNST